MLSKCVRQQCGRVLYRGVPCMHYSRQRFYLNSFVFLSRGYFQMSSQISFEQVQNVALPKNSTGRTSSFRGFLTENNPPRVNSAWQESQLLQARRYLPGEYSWAIAIAFRLPEAGRGSFPLNGGNLRPVIFGVDICKGSRDSICRGINSVMIRATIV